ncbi:family 20 glycosylhydrolase [Streptomyces sp. NPDC058045]|uniref:family 20 glycosylhydrolase n=1 Tax=Streptomyces sp. NPDC058045 TaxID=3346311 RepID=UPI0036F021D5
MSAPSEDQTVRRRTVLAVAGSAALAASVSTAFSAPAFAAGAAPTADSPWPEPARDVARDGTATASSEYDRDPARFAASHVNDGDLSTRWGSNSPENGYPDVNREWVQVELAEPSPVHHVAIHWETARAAHYEIQVSDDGKTWRTALDVPDAPGGREILELGLTAPVRFVRMQGVETATGWGYSIFAMEVWNGPRPGAGLPAGRIIPVPVEQTSRPDDRPFALGPNSRIIAADKGAREVAGLLAGYLRPATGFTLPVVGGGAGKDGDITLLLDRSQAPSRAKLAVAEGYVLTAGEGGLRIAAATAHGLFNGVQTLRQLLPPWIEGTEVRPGPWTVEATEIRDYPRFVHRGLMADAARNFLRVEEVKALIDGLAQSKGNVLHWHLTDDQGWRIQIDSRPRLTEVGGGMSMPGGRTGFYTKDDIRSVVRYATERHVQVIPEIEMPSHTTAARTAYPELSGAGGYLADLETTYAFIDDVLREVAALFPSPYVHLGADESDMPHDQYVRFLRRIEGIARSHKKTMIGWSPSCGVVLDTETVHHYWQDQSREMSREWFNPRRPVVLSPTQQTYLDYPYPTYDTRRAYTWNPDDLTDGWTGAKVQRDYGLNNEDILGIEAPIWGERMLRGLPDVQYQVFPRLPAILEKAWSPAEATEDAEGVVARTGTQGVRWLFAGRNFWVDPGVRWEAAAVGTALSTGKDGAVNAAVASLALPGVAPDKVTATVDWGDGDTSTATVSGDAPGDRQVNGVYQVKGEHRYTRRGTFRGTVRITGPGGVKAQAEFTVTARV